jgi:TfoX/Sxy family transcriptional regulator of competence genes
MDAPSKTRRSAYHTLSGIKAVIRLASNKEYLDFILEQLSSLEDISYRAMMGEYIIYYRGKIVGGIYDDRFLVKPTASARKLMPEAAEELPYEGASPMLLVSDVDDREFLADLLNEMYGELPAPKKKKPGR